MKTRSLFRILQDEEKAKKLGSLAQELLVQFRKLYVDERQYVQSYTQTAQAKAISLGVFSENEKPTAVQNLIHLIAEKNNAFEVGIIGHRVLFRVLCENGYGEKEYYEND